MEKHGKLAEISHNRIGEFCESLFILLSFVTKLHGVFHWRKDLRNVKPIYDMTHRVFKAMENFGSINIK